MQLERRSLKKSGLQQDSNLWLPWIPVRCYTNWAMKPHIGREVNLLSSYYFPVAVNGTLSNWKDEAWKNQGFNEIGTCDRREYQYDALPTELWSHTLGARSIYWVHIIFPCSEVMWSIYEIINICTNCGCRWKWRMIIAVNFPIYAIGKKKPEKIRSSTGFEPVASVNIGAVLYQLSFEATH